MAKPGKKAPAGLFLKIRVLIAGDHTVVRDGFAAIVQQDHDMEVVAETGDGNESVELWKLHHPDLALLALRMPGHDRLSAIYGIRAWDPNASLIILTTLVGMITFTGS